MKIDKIEVKRIKNLGNYESLTLSIAATPDPTKPLNGEFEKITKFIDFKLNETDRAAKYKKYLADIESGELNEADRKKAEAFIQKYEDFQKEIADLEFEFIQNESEV